MALPLSVSVKVNVRTTSPAAAPIQAFSVFMINSSIEAEAYFAHRNPAAVASPMLLGAPFWSIA